MLIFGGFARFAGADSKDSKDFIESKENIESKSQDSKIDSKKPSKNIESKSSKDSKEITTLQIEGTCHALDEFNDSQNEVLLYAYYYGKDFDLGYILAAIAWKESCAGEYLINFQDPSAGIYHAHIPSVIKKYTKYKDTPFIRNVIGQMLIADARLASAIALDNLHYWQKINKGNLQNTLKSYNSGFSWKSNATINKTAQNYANDIERKATALQSYLHALIHTKTLKEPKLDIKY